MVTVTVADGDTPVASSTLVLDVPAVHDGADADAGMAATAFAEGSDADGAAAPVETSEAAVGGEEPQHDAAPSSQDHAPSSADAQAPLSGGANADAQPGTTDDVGVHSDPQPSNDDAGVADEGDSQAAAPERRQRGTCLLTMRQPSDEDADAGGVDQAAAPESSDDASPSAEDAPAVR